MPTQSQVQTNILTAQLNVANLVYANLTTLSGGGSFVKWDFIKKYTRAINCVSRQYNLQDYSSTGFLTAYDCLLNFIGGNTANPLNQNAQNPNTVININNNIIGTNVVRDIIPFTNANPVQLLNYNNTYKQLYGNNLITLDIFLTGYTEDEQTPPKIIYAVSNDPTTDIVSITWDYPAPVSGYILIAGVMPISGTPAAGGGGSIPFTFDQTYLQFDNANSEWYLPLTLPTGKNPGYTMVNGKSISTTYNINYSPARLYAFAPNTVAQNIVISVS